MTDFASLPGAPPASDTQAWAPAGGPQGAVPDDRPFTPRFVDTASLTPEQRHRWAEVRRSGDRAALEAFTASLNAGALEVSPPSAPEAPAPTPAPDPAVSPERAALAEQLAEHGSDIAAFDALQPRIDDFQLHLEGLTDEQRHAALRQSEEQMIQSVYRGSETALAQGLRDIETAALAVGGKELVQAINEAGVLADPSLHMRVLMMARHVLANRGTS